MSKIIKIIWSYEWLRFSRNTTLVFLLASVFLIGVYAIYCGKGFIESQQTTIVKLKEKELAEFDSYVDVLQDDEVSDEEKRLYDLASRPAFAWSRHGYHAILPPSNVASLAIGQRDLYRYYYRITGMSLQYQLYQNEIANPYYLMVGNLDLSFIFIYILPLLVIVFTYALYSGEADSGILNLLRSQKLGVGAILAARLGFYFAIITFLILSLSLIGFLVSGSFISGSSVEEFLAWSFVSIGYNLVWFGLIWVVIAFRLNTSLNAIISMASWVLILIIVPAVFNIVLDYMYPLNSVELAELTRRTGLEDETDDQESKEVIMEFSKYRPEYSIDTSDVKENMMSKAYAAYTFLKERNSEELVEKYSSTIEKRARMAAKWRFLNPAATIQETLSVIAQSDLLTYRKFQSKISEFHEEITDFYFERLFKGEKITNEAYSRRPVFISPSVEVNWQHIYGNFFVFMLLGGALFFLGYFIIKVEKK